MTLTEGEGPVTSSYIDSMCVLLSGLLASSRAALIFALLLIKITTITVVKTIMLTHKAVAREIIIIMLVVLVGIIRIPVEYNGLLICTIMG